MDLYDIEDYIALDNPEAARRIVSAIQKKCFFLAEHPKLAAPYEKSKNLRKHSDGNYLIFYRPVEDGIEVIRVLHSARDIENILKRGEQV